MTAYQRQLQARIRALYNEAHGIPPVPQPIDPSAILCAYMNPPCEGDNP